MDEKERAERKAKREARREKQRYDNINRAEKMHKARLQYESENSSATTLIKAKKRTEKSKNLLASKTKQNIHIGCSGWFYWHWGNDFYKDIPTSKWFEHYKTKFKTVELNAPFYSWPTIATVKSWLRQAGRTNFIYTVKVSELITHTKRFIGTKTLVKDFGLIADLLGPRMGCFLFQLPPSYHYTPQRLRSIISQLDHARRNVIEFRHKSWWNEKVYAAFRERGTIFCSCSGPRLPDELVKTSGDIYIRFHGTKKWYLHNYTKAELQEWADRIKQSGAKNIWAYFNNDREGHAIQNAKTLMRLLAKI